MIGASPCECTYRHLGWNLADCDRTLSIGLQPSGDVLLEHHVPVGSAKSERAGAGAAHTVRRNVPRCQLGIDSNRRMIEIDVGVALLAVNAGGQHLIMKRE